jgi:hypothetical protein
LFFHSFLLAVWVVLQHHFVSTALGSYSLTSMCILFFKTWDVNWTSIKYNFEYIFGGNGIYVLNKPILKSLVVVYYFCQSWH